LLTLKGGTLARLKKTEESIQSLNLALKLADGNFPKDLELRNLVVDMLSSVLMTNKRFDSVVPLAVGHIEKWKSIEPDGYIIAGWLDRLGNIFGNLKRYDDSIKALKEAIDYWEKTENKKPEQLEFTRLNLAISLFRSGKKSEAKKIFGSAKKRLETILPLNHPARKQIETLEKEINGEIPSPA